ncbi:TetR/AcrR family transcriptional regulator [Nocardioides daphniae]|uniref:TetR/AcrR family transcriptional regulator n=1 Tax=Nocardioides daphniae TaxID=402297 RepID=UPI00193100A6|nr:TetR/AcrR family transcriptional regulator [Nocardioides daphniae]
MPTDSASPSRDRILAVATDLFAKRGYGATSTRAIGDAAGLNIATVAYHVGGKEELYREVMRLAHVAQRDAVVAALETLTACDPTPEATRTAMHGFVDAYLSFCLRHPEVPTLWMRRWLAEGEDLAAIEEEFAGPLVAQVAEQVRATLDRAGLTHEVDVEMLVYSIVWTTHSFTRAGFIDASGKRQDPSSLEMMDRFRAHLHHLVDGAIGADEHSHQD